MKLNRRSFLATSGLALQVSLSSWAQTSGGPKKIAFLGTEVRQHSHAQHFLDRLVMGYGWRGGWQEPRVEMASVYIDQFPEEGDLGKQRIEKYGLTLYPTIAEALTLGTGELAGLAKQGIKQSCA